MSDNTAILAGFTREVMFHGLGCERHLFIPPAADVSDCFAAYDADECRFVKIAGWLGTVQDLASY